MKMTKLFGALMLGLLLAGLTASCHKGVAQQAGEKIDNAVQDTKDSVKETVQDTKDAAHDAAQDMKK